MGPNATDHVGKPKGLRQALWERGLLVSSKMTKTNQSPELNMETVMAGCADFKAQKSQLQLEIESRGHLFDMSPKYGCEIAGVGIEYSWGRSKLHFRKHCTFKNSDLMPRVKASLSEEVIPLSLVRKYARKTRDYMRAYAAGAVGPALVKQLKTYKTHRSALDTHSSFINEDV